MKQAAATSIGLGMPNIPLALVPGHVGTQSREQLLKNILEITVDQVIDNFTKATAAKGDRSEPAARDVVFTGSFSEVNGFFHEQEYSDGLPVVPPTIERVEEFLKYTDHDANEMLGVLLPDNRAATIWSIAVNGVMAGCKPSYMPILVALVEAMCDPRYGVEHSGNTPGADTLIILNGPIIKELDFNYTQGALRDGFRPNTSIGRFWRLYLRNVAGFLLHKTDKATFGNTWRVVFAENDDALAEIGWLNTAQSMGFGADENTVTIARYTGGGSLSSVSGSTPEQLLPYLADTVQKYHMWQLTFTVSHGNGTLRPLIIISPIIAQTIAKAGWSKSDVQRFLWEHARLPAWQLERQLRDWNIRGVWNLEEDVKAGKIPDLYFDSNDPERLVPIVWKPEDIMIAVGGDPFRNNAYVFAHNGFLGFPTCKKIRLPDTWPSLAK